MVSLTYKLSGIFLAISLVPLVIGITGVLSLQTIGQTLNRNNSALEHLSRLIASANDSLADNIRIQTNFHEATDQVSQTQQIANATFQDMRDMVLPRTFALANIRYSLLDANEARLALFLLLTMRHLDFATQHAAMEIQKARLDTALAGIWNASEAYRTLIDESKTDNDWLNAEEKLNAWRENHIKFMGNMAEMEQLNRDLVRGGPLFAAASRTAFETAFVEGSVIRAECEKIMDEMNGHITRLTTNSIRRTLLSQIRSQYLVDALNADYRAVMGKAEELRTQFASAGEISAAASRESEEALSATTSRFRYMAVFSAFGVIMAIALGVTQAVRISRPIRVMADQMTRLAIGDMTSDVATASLAMRDEVGQLARALQGLINSNRTEIRLADAMATGDYTLRVNLRSESDRLGRALATMVRNSNETLSGVTFAIHRMAKSADEVATASTSLSQGALTSASALEEIASSVTNIDQQAKENADHASRANQLATSSRDAAKRGYGAVGELVAAMRDIQQSGKRIAVVAKLIDDIAFQTNLLALNAAVEAARAGRHGKGFSVVADEVRNLSGRSARAAKETEEMVTAMTGKMEAGALVAERTDKEFQEIVAATEQVAHIFDNITVASNEQSRALAQIVVSLNQIDSVIQENTANAGYTAASARDLSGQVDRLRQSVSKFRLDAEAGVDQSFVQEPPAFAAGGREWAALPMPFETGGAAYAHAATVVPPGG